MRPFAIYKNLPLPFEIAIYAHAVDPEGPPPLILESATVPNSMI